MRWLITGGAGFIGCNTAARVAREDHEVVVYDDLSRKGSESNAQWLLSRRGVRLYQADVRDYEALGRAFRQEGPFDVVLHLAGQVAVTTSVANPRTDFEVNALGTFNVCEAVRNFSPSAILLNASTNKVYGGMKDVAVVERDGRYDYVHLPYGVPEDQAIDFHSPYGCSKGAGEQYVRDYARIYGLKTINFRQSCIYGYRQFGMEDQGWVAWFTIAAVLGRPITIYGDGKQVRDVLFIDDLIDCYLAAVRQSSSVAGETFNMGGGPDRALSLVELLSLLEGFLDRRICVEHRDWRPADQKVFICDIRKAGKQLGWAPRVTPYEGVKRLLQWVLDERVMLAEVV